MIRESQKESPRIQLFEMFLGTSFVTLQVPQQQGVTCASHAAWAIKTIMDTPPRTDIETIRTQIATNVARNRHTFVNEFSGLSLIRSIIGESGTDPSRDLMLIQKTPHGWETAIYMRMTRVEDNKRLYPMGISTQKLKSCALSRKTSLPVIINTGAHWTAALLKQEYVGENKKWTLYYMDSLNGQIPKEVKEILCKHE